MGYYSTVEAGVSGCKGVNGALLLLLLLALLFSETARNIDGIVALGREDEVLIEIIGRLVCRLCMGRGGIG